MREYKYSKRCPCCGEWIVLGLSDAQRFLPNVYGIAEGFRRSEGCAFDLKATVSSLATVEEVDKLIEELETQKKLIREKKGASS